MFTGKASDHSWMLIRSQDNGIAGVASTSTKVPIKRTGFPQNQNMEKFENAKSYTEWLFVYVPPTPALPQAQGAMPNSFAPPVLHTN
jgi:hypothetical protein